MIGVSRAYISRYRLLRRIGGGAMGEVYLAEDEHLERQVAIKVVRPDLEEQEEMRRLFQREARAVSALDHPHILPLFEYGEVHEGEEVLMYLVMPFHPEGSLEHWLHKRREAQQPLSLAEVEQIVCQAAAALQYAHNCAIVHQDVKLSNFLVSQEPQASGAPYLLLADFGLARMSVGTSTGTTNIRGTPIYMAPEQWSGRPLPACDQYALAIMTYKLLTGRYPFQGDPVRIMYMHLQVEPAAPSSLNAQLSPAIDAVLQRALSKQPEQRYPNVAAFAEALQQAIRADADAPTEPQQVLLPLDDPSDAGLWQEEPLRASALLLANEMVYSPGQSQPPESEGARDNANAAGHGLETPQANRGRAGITRRRALLLAAALLLLLGAVLGYGSISGRTPALSPTTTATLGPIGRQNATPTPRPTTTRSGPIKVVATARAHPTPTATPAPAFRVTSVDLSLSPSTVSCGLLGPTSARVTYSATFNVTGTREGRVVTFRYTTDDGHTYDNGSIAFDAGDNSQSYTITRTVAVPGCRLQNGTYQDQQAAAWVTTIFPNSVTSPTVAPNVYMP